MKKRTVSAILVFLLLFAFSAFGADKIRIVSTIPDLASLAEMVGGEKVSVVSLAKGTQDPHQIEVLPSYMVKLRRADLFLIVGLDLDLWAFQLRDGSRNAKLITVDCSQYIEPLEKPASKVDRSQGDIHIYGNPHYWLDPLNAEPIMRAILAGLKRVSPENSSFFEANFNRARDLILQKTDEWLHILKSVPERKIIFYHNSWPYFARRFELEVVNFIEPKPGIPPSPAQTALLIKQVQEQGVRVIAMEPYFDRRVPELIARQTGARVLVLPQSVGGVKEAKNYVALFDYIVSQLHKAFTE